MVPTSSSSPSPSNRSISNQDDEPTIDGRNRSPRCDPCPIEPDRKTRSSARLKHRQEKKKAKVDWTPELHKKFVQAVEKLGIDKAVPSKILELMGTDRLTRHNVASHLQKYRSHRKHMLSREAEAMSWARRRHHIRGSSSSYPKIGKRDANESSNGVRTTSFPHISAHSRPLHVWGHPSADQSWMYTWQFQPRDYTLWYWHHQNVPAQGLPYYTPPYLPTSQLAAPSMHRVNAASVGVPISSRGQSDVYASKERIDAAIVDVLCKPWTPLPLGLKGPNVDSVMAELQSHGISKVPPRLLLLP